MNTRSRLWMGLAVLASATLTFFKIDDPDVWWHLSVGRLIFQTHQIHRQEMLTWSILGKEWQAKEWLHDLILYSIYRVGGFTGLAVAKVVLVGIIIMFLFSLARRLGAGRLETFGAMVVMVFLSRTYFIERPQLWDYLFVVIFIDVLHQFLVSPHPTLSLKGEGGRRPGEGGIDWSNILLVLPVLEMLWVNVHGGAAFIGLFIIGVAIWVGSFKKNLRLPLLLTFLACLAATLVNPSGFGVYGYTWKLIHAPFIPHMTEWMKPTLKDRAYVLVLAISTLVALFKVRQESFLSFVLLFFVAISTRAYRFTPFLYLVSIPLLSVALQRRVGLGLPGEVGDCLTTLSASEGEEFSPHRDGRTRPALRFLYWILIWGICGWITWHVWEDHTQGLVRWGVGPFGMPDQAARFILEKGIRGRMFNPFELGGYLEWKLWPQERPFIDGRAQLEFGTELIALSSSWYKPAVWRRLDDQYHFDYAVVPNGPDYRCRNFDHSRDWALVFWDDEALVYVRRLEKFKKLIRLCGFQVMTPNDFSLSFLDKLTKEKEAQARHELERVVRESPDHAIADLMLIKLDLADGRRSEALERAKEAVAQYPWRSDVHRALSLAQRS